MAHRIGDGKVTNYTCTGAVTNGELLVIGDRAGIAMEAGATGDLIAVSHEGDFSAAKKAAASTSWAAGERVYYMTTGSTKKLTGVAAAGQMIGVGTIAAATGDTTGRVTLLGGLMPLETQA